MCRARCELCPPEKACMIDSLQTLTREQICSSRQSCIVQCSPTECISCPCGWEGHEACPADKAHRNQYHTYMILLRALKSAKAAACCAVSSAHIHTAACRYQLSWCCDHLHEIPTCCLGPVSCENLQLEPHLQLPVAELHSVEGLQITRSDRRVR